MATTTFILLGAQGTETHVDLGLHIGTLSLSGQEYVVQGSDGDNSFFLRPDGYSFDFTDNAGGSDKIYLTGQRSQYTVSEDAGVKTIARSVGDTTETVKVAADAINMTVVFADGHISANALSEGTSDVLGTDETSGIPNLPAVNSGGIRLGTSGGAVDQTNAIGLNGVTFSVYGNGGVDQVFVTAGGQVDATRLGAAEDRIYLEGSWGDYTKSWQGSHLTLTRDVTNALSGQIDTESVKVIGGVGAANDRLFFADGSVSTRAALLALRANNDNAYDITGDASWDSGNTSFSSVAALEAPDTLTLAVDSGAEADDWVTSNGTVNVAGLSEGHIWQYSTDSGVTWTNGTGTSFVLSGQQSGEQGISFAAGTVQVRQINPFGVASEPVANSIGIVVDSLTVTPGFSTNVTGFARADGAANRMSVSLATDLSDITVQFWVYIDELATGSNRQLTGGVNYSARIQDGGEIGVWNAGSSYLDTGIVVSHGWNFISFSVDYNTDDVVTTIVNADNPDGLAATVRLTGHNAKDSNDTSMTIGSAAAGNTGMMETFRDLQIWEGTRDTQTIVSDSRAQLAGSELNLKSYWRLDGNTNAAPVNLVDGAANLTITGTVHRGREVLDYFPGYSEQAVPDTLILRGVSEAFATITVTYGSGTVAGTTVADSQGNWSFKFSEGVLSAGAQTITATAEDDAGNTDTITGSIVVDLSLPTIPDLLATSDTGQSNSDNVTYDTTPSFSGKLPSGTTTGTVQILIDGAVVASSDDAQANGLVVQYDSGSDDGTWDYTPTTALAAGTHRIQVQVVDNISPVLDITIDDTATHASVDGPAFFTFMDTGNSATTHRGGLTLVHDYSGTGAVAGWVYIADPTGAAIGADQRIVHTYRDMSLRIEEGTGKLELYSYKSGARAFQDTGFVATAGWHHFVISDGLDDKNFYWNGVASTTSLNTANADRDEIHFGRHADNDEGALDGAFRDIQFWDRALTAEEVQRYYAGEGVDLNDPALVGFWALDETSGTTNSVLGGPDLTKQSNAAIGTQQELIESAAFTDGNLVISGTLANDIVSLTVTWDDGDALTTADPSVAAEIDLVTRTWAATFTEAQMSQMADGSVLNFTLDVEDKTGNTKSTPHTAVALLELDNQAPVENTGQTIDPIVLSFGAQGGADGTALLNLLDLANDADVSVDDVAFTDADTAGSSNASLQYSALLQNGEPLPSWLELTPAGLLRLAPNQTVDDFGGTLTVRITAADGGGASAFRDVVLLMPTLPDLEAASDSSVNSDDITNDATPTITGSLPSGTEAGATLTVFVNDVQVASGSAQGANGDLTIDFDNDTWEYTPTNSLSDGDNVIHVSVDGKLSPPLTITVDRTVEVTAPYDAEFATNNASNADTGGASASLSFSGSGTLLANVYVGDLSVDGNQTVLNLPLAGMAVRIGSDNQLYLREPGAGPYSSTGLSVAEGWNFLAVTQSASGVQLYLNDEPAFSAGGGALNSTVVEMGYIGTSSESLVDGRLKGVQAWDRVLSDTEINDIRTGAASVDVNDQSLLAYWPLDNASGLENAVPGGPPLTARGSAALMATAPFVLEEALLSSDELSLSGTYADDVQSIQISWDDADGATANASVPAVLEGGVWTATFPRSVLEAMQEGNQLSLQVTATDLAGNSKTIEISDVSTLELTNQDPVAETGNTIPELFAGAGTTSVGSATQLVDLTDLAGDGSGISAFSDADVFGSANASITYSATMENNDPLPSWLEVTSSGIVQVVRDETVPPDFTSATITVTATDGAGGSALRNVSIGAAIGLTSVVAGEAELDVRSDLQLENPLGSNLVINTSVVDTSYQIRLVQVADGGGKTGFAGEDVDGSLTLRIDIDGTGSVSTVGGNLTIVDGKAVIDFDEHMDLSNNYEIHVDKGLFTDAGSTLTSTAIGAGQISFSTVTPGGTGGTVARKLQDGAIVDGDSWFDGSGGDYLGNTFGLQANLSDMAGIVAIGRDLESTDAVHLNVGSRTELTDFGSDDLLYIDRAVGSTANDLTTNEISVNDHGGLVPTELQFSTVDDQSNVTMSGAGVFIHFEDRPGVGPDDEDLLTATTFLDANAGQGEHSFESLTGNGQPIIGG